MFVQEGSYTAIPIPMNGAMVSTASWTISRSVLIVLIKELYLARSGGILLIHKCPTFPFWNVKGFVGQPYVNRFWIRYLLLSSEQKTNFQLIRRSSDVQAGVGNLFSWLSQESLINRYILRSKLIAGYPESQSEHVIWAPGVSFRMREVDVRCKYVSSPHQIQRSLLIYSKHSDLIA